MANKQQTAVEWLFENMPEDYVASIPYELADHALQMEREQIEQAHGTKVIRSIKQGVDVYETITGEQYYEDTYGNNRSDKNH